MNVAKPDQSYAGVLLRESPDNPRTAGVVTISALYLEFTSAEMTLKMPLSGIDVTRGGSNERLLFIKHPVHRGLTIISSDPAIVGALKGLNDPRINAQIRLAGRRRQRVILTTALIVGSLIGTVAALIWAHDPIAGAVARRIPFSWEQQAGNLIAPLYTSGAIKEPAVERALEQFVAPLTTVLLEQSITPKFSIVPHTELNAFALPGGFIVIFSGVLEQAESGAEVLGVLAHELAHVSERHVMRNIVTSLGIYTVFSLLIGDAVGAVAAIANAAPVLLSKSYSRDLERDADKKAFDYLLQADIDPRGMVRFFKRVAAESSKNASPISDAVGQHEGLSFLSTHPTNAERIQHLEERITRLPAERFRDTEREFRALQRALREAVAGSGKKINSAAQKGE
jgi:predicted Zn-dependent protease